jgi:hypothetical protein
MFQTKEEIKNWLDNYGIMNYTINNNLTVDVDDSVRLFNKSITEFPIQFGIVKGNFNFSRNKITSLKGCPHTVHGEFDCSHNQLVTLKHCPKLVHGDFYFHGNKVSLLDYLPDVVDGVLACGINPIVNFSGIFNANINEFSHWASTEEKIIKDYEQFYEIAINIQGEIEGWSLHLDNNTISKMKANKELNSELIQNYSTTKKIKL